MRILNIGDKVNFEGQTATVLYSYRVHRKLDTAFQEYVLQLSNRRLVISHSDLKKSGATLEGVN